MKFTIHSWNPLRIWKQKPLTKPQILLYDIAQEIAHIDDKLYDLSLQQIKLEHQREGFVAQQEFVMEGEMVEEANDPQSIITFPVTPIT